MSLRQMRSEVHGTQLPLNGCDVSDKLLQRGLGYGACFEQRVQVTFPVKKLLTQLHRLSFHVLKDGLRLSTLFLSKLEGFREVQDVSGTWIMIQLRRLRKPIPLSERYP
jgi:hypothetical protein